MGKPLSTRQKAANKVKIDKAAGKHPDPKDVLIASGKTPKPTGPLTTEIDMLVARRGAIQANQGRAMQSMRDHQARLDKAESASAEMSVQNMADPSPTNATLASDARVHRNAVLVQYDQAQHELKLIPGALEKLKRDIARLQAEKRIQEKALITSSITDISEYQKAAVEALAKYTAYVCLTGERKPAYIDAREVGKRIDKERTLTNRYHQIYAELESGMDFDSL